MRNRGLRGPAAPVSVLLAAVVASTCLSERQVTGPNGTGGDCSIPVSSPILGSTRALIAIRDLAFQPATVRVKAGTVVTWINCEPETVDPHTTTSETEIWASSSLPPGATYSHTFDEAGEFPYFCVPHPFMRGTVIVE